jgi:hypothetical protein
MGILCEDGFPVLFLRLLHILVSEVPWNRGTGEWQDFQLRG